jgi:carotenoid cleavage dioxygenase-like enzyme
MRRDQPVWEVANWDADVPPTQYVRYTLDPVQQKLVEDAPVVICKRANEFPTIPKARSSLRHRYAYTVGSHQPFEPDPMTGMGSGAAGSVWKLDTQDPSQNESYSFLPHEFVSEPCFVPKVGTTTGSNNNNIQTEDRGYLILYVLNGLEMTTDLVIFNVEGKGSLSSGPVTRMQLPVFLPHGLHGMFAAAGEEFPWDSQLPN